jgi:CDP-L-myo-inositol myo-inositolphosphotransferase
MSEQVPLTKTSDGPVSLLVNRRISARISGPLARAGVTPNQATLLATALGAAAAAIYAVELWWLAGLALQASSIGAGIDGEIARRTDRASRFGDFLDTVADRFVEFAALLGIGYGLAQVEALEDWAWPLAFAALGATFLLAAASEKYRSVMHANYPKRQFEPVFAYLSAGRDVRVFYLMLGSLAAVWRVEVLFWTLAVLTVVMYLNLILRIAVLAHRMDCGTDEEDA